MFDRYQDFSQLSPCNPLHVYIHVPFCPRKCRFCIYYTIRQYSDYTINSYLQAVISDINRLALAHNLDSESSFLLTSIYFGGGSPNVLSASEIGILLDNLNLIGEFSADAEISMEAFPEPDLYRNLIDYKHNGVNRISIGVQDFNASVLAASRRPAVSRQDVKTLVDTCKNLDLQVNVDLILGLPTQTRSGFLGSLEQLLAIGPNHISIYRYISGPYSAAFRLRESEPFTKLERGELIETRIAAVGMLEHAGYHEYAADHFVQSVASQCMHELAEWRGEDVLGIGPGSQSFLINHLYRQMPNLKSYREHISDGAVSGFVALTNTDLCRRIALLGLTKLMSLNVDLLQLRFEDSAYSVLKDIGRLVGGGYLRRDGDEVRITASEYMPRVMFELSNFANPELRQKLIS